MGIEKPDYHDADLILRFYDLRREPVMRESRDAMGKSFWPVTYEDLLAVTSNPENPLNRPWRQTTSYWEMVYGFARNGIVNADFLAENAGEGFFIFAKISPFLEKYRAEFSSIAFQNAEWLIKNSKAAALRYEMIKKRVEATLSSKK